MTRRRLFQMLAAVPMAVLGKPVPNPDETFYFIGQKEIWEMTPGYYRSLNGPLTRELGEEVVRRLRAQSEW